MYNSTPCIYLILSLAHQSVCFSFNSFYNEIKYHTVSQLYEQCDRRWVPKNVKGLSDDLDKHVFGQELAVDVILGALESHSKNEYKRKPLVLSFHGWTGGGKGYVTDFIVKNWFAKRDKSSFVKIYNAKNDFPLQNKSYEYQKRLQFELESTVRKCSESIFVFDEVDKYPHFVLDGIKPYLDYRNQVNGLDFREAIFIFITNCGGTLITNTVLEKFEKGFTREDLSMKDFEKNMKMISYNNKGGFFQSDLIKYHLIDYFVPFLPLERQHVISCIEAEFIRQRRHNHDYVDLEDITMEIMQELTFGPAGNNLFSISGCKHTHKVLDIIEREKRKKRRRNKTEF